MSARPFTLAVALSSIAFALCGTASRASAQAPKRPVRVLLIYQQQAETQPMLEFSQPLRDAWRTCQTRRLGRGRRRCERSDVTAGFLDQQQSADRIPDRQRQLDERVEPPLRNMRELQRTRAEVAHRDAGRHHPVPDLQVLHARRAIVMAERDVCAGERLRRRRMQARRARALVAPCAVAARGAIKLAAHRIEDDADARTAFLHVSDRDIPVRHATQEVMRAVDRIDDPATVDRAFEARRRFLAQKTVAGKRRGDLTA